MKETNMEHFRSEIEEIIARHKHYLPAVVDGKPIKCAGLRCNECMLYKATEPCSIHFVKWLMSEYKPEPVLTQREKHFVEFVQTGYIARDSDGRIDWYENNPNKRNYYWYADRGKSNSVRVFCGDNLFRFITWEDEEAWSVEELRKLKVENAD